MGEASARDDGHGDDDGHHGPTIGVAIWLNVAINAVLNAGFGYGIAWLHWQDYELAWYTHHLHGLFETDFVREDLIVQGISVGIIVTLIVAAILHRQWDGDHLQPGMKEGLLLESERTRGSHLLTWTGAMAAMGLLVSVLVTAVTVTGAGDGVEGSAFALARTANGFVVGGIAGGLVTASWITNLTAGKLVKPDEGESFVARTMARSSEHPWIVLGVVLLLTGALGAGLADLDTNVDETDTMPRGTHHHEAAVEVAHGFNGTHNNSFELHFRTDGAQCQQDNRRNLDFRAPEDVDCGNITDEVYVRAMEDVFEFLETYTYEPEESFFTDESDDNDDNDDTDEIEEIDSPVTAQVGLPSYLKLANWSLAGGQGQAPDDAFSLPQPEDRVRVNAAEDLAWNELSQAQSATISEDGTQAVVTYHVEEDSGLTSRQLGAFVLEARDDYVDQGGGSGGWDVFTGDNKPLVTVNQPVANAHQAQVLEEDGDSILVALGLSSLVALLVVFRHPVAALVATASTAAAGTWTYGTLGHAGVPLSELDLLQAPLIIAAGVFVAVPTIEAFLDHVEEGREPSEAFRLAGDRATFPWYVAGLVTLLALTALGLGPTALVADAAWVSMLGLASVLVLTVTFVPAVMGLVGTSDRLVTGGPSPGSTPGSSRGWASRSIAGAVVLAITLASVAGVSGLDFEAWHEPVDHWPEDDNLRQDHRQALLGFHGLDRDEQGFPSNAVVVQGEIANPQTLSYIDRLSDELDTAAEDSELIDTRTSRDLPSVIRDWVEVCCGAQSLAQGTLADALQGQTSQADPYPQTEEEINATLRDMFDSPYAAIAAPVVKPPASDTAIEVVQVRSGDADATERAWNTVQGAIEEAEADRPEEVTTSFVGPASTSYLTSEDQGPWLIYLLAAGVGTASLLALAYTRSLRGGLAVTLVVGLSALWQLGLWSVIDTPFNLAATLGLTVGLFAATGMGTQLVWPADHVEGVPRRRGVGRSTLFSVLVLVLLFGGLISIADSEIQLPTLLIEDALVGAIAGAVCAAVAAFLVGRAVLPAREPESDQARVVQADVDADSGDEEPAAT